MMHFNVRHLVLSLGSAYTLESQLDCSTPLASKPSLLTPWLYTSALIILFTARSASFNITNLVGPDEKTSEPIALQFTFSKKLKIWLFHVEVMHNLHTSRYLRLSLSARADSCSEDEFIKRKRLPRRLHMLNCSLHHYRCRSRSELILRVRILK